jgi:hypothetical protein
LKEVTAILREKPMKTYQTVAVPLAIVAVIFIPGCAPDSQASKEAGRGAAYGAVGGAVAGAVSSLIFGGNPLQGAVAGGLTGAASGAAVGAMAGAEADRAAARPVAEDPKLAALRQKIGDANYASAMLLAQCQHKRAIESAQETFAATQDPQQKTFALAIQAVAAEESGDKALAASTYPKIVQLDPSRGSADKLRADALEGVIRVQAARKQHGLPPTCT